MKYLLLFLMVWTMGGCVTTDVKPTPAPELPPAGAFPVPNAPSDLKLAWDGHPKAAKMTAILDEAMKDLPEAGPVKTLCAKLTLKPCAKVFLSYVAKRENGKFDSSLKYNETGHLAGVVSRGLFQISFDSAKGYNCKVNKAEDLHKDEVNIDCAVRILSRWVEKDGVFIGEYPCVKDGKKAMCYLGGSRYWSVLRSKNGTSESYKYITTEMAKR